ncbi:hypothetical protein AAW52_07135 [Vibrio diabolicus]|nr:hypothetical protein AAW52_07135 [Vibrio diabolicus]
MHCQSVFTHIKDEDSAIEALRSELTQQNLSYVMCYYTEEYDFELIREAFLEHFPGVPFHGASSCQAVMTDQGFHTGPVIAALAIYDSGPHAYGTGISNYDSGDSVTLNQVAFNSMSSGLI